MRFVYGPIPESRVLNPQQEGWTLLREWGPVRLAAVALLLGSPFLITAVVLLAGMRAEVRELLRAEPFLAAGCLLALLGMVPLHEPLRRDTSRKPRCPPRPSPRPGPSPPGSDVGRRSDECGRSGSGESRS